MFSDWLKTQKKPPRTNQILAVLFNNKIQENGHGFLHSSTLAGLKQVLMH